VPRAQVAAGLLMQAAQGALGGLAGRRQLLLRHTPLMMTMLTQQLQRCRPKCRLPWVGRVPGAAHAHKLLLLSRPLLLRADASAGPRADWRGSCTEAAAVDGLLVVLACFEEK
jgi:hypothetical protein